jgi:hypothetical protein
MTEICENCGKIEEEHFEDWKGRKVNCSKFNSKKFKPKTTKPELVEEALDRAFGITDKKDCANK